MKTSAQQSIDAVTESISSRLRRLPPKRAALFSACVAERFSRFYDPFALKHEHLGRLLIRDAMDAIWQFLTDDCSMLDLRGHLTKVGQATPASEEYDSLESVLAQNLCIVVDAAIRSCLRESDGEFVAGEFGIELLRAAVSHEETGFIDVGSGPGSQEFEAKLVEHPLIADEIVLERSDLTSLESASLVWSKLVANLKSSAESRRIDVSRILDT